MNNREICVSMRENRDANKLDGVWDDKMAAIEFHPEFRKYFCYISLFHISFFKKNKTLNAKIGNEYYILPVLKNFDSQKIELSIRKCQKSAHKLLIRTASPAVVSRVIKKARKGMYLCNRNI